MTLDGAVASGPDAEAQPGGPAFFIATGRVSGAGGAVRASLAVCAAGAADAGEHLQPGAVRGVRIPGGDQLGERLEGEGNGADRLAGQVAAAIVEAAAAVAGGSEGIGAGSGCGRLEDEGAGGGEAGAGAVPGVKAVLGGAPGEEAGDGGTSRSFRGSDAQGLRRWSLAQAPSCSRSRGRR